MSWDVLIISLPEGVRTLQGLSEGYDANQVNLGPTADVLSTLRGLFPSIDLRDPTWGVLTAETFSMEFNVGSNDPCGSIMLHIRGDDAAIAPIRLLCERTGWSALDVSDGEVMDFSGDPGKSLREWRAYRDQVVPGAPERGVSLPFGAGGRVFFDAVGAAPQPSRPKRWWQFWKR